MDRQGLIEQFLHQTGWSGASSKRIAGDASNRKYDRLTKTDGNTLILMDAPPDTGEDVRPFIQIAGFLRETGLSAPEIHHADPENGLLLIEDFGDALFADLMTQDPEQQTRLYQAAADVLIHLSQVAPLDLSVCDAPWLIEMTAPVFEWFIGDHGQEAAFAQAFQPFAEQAAHGKKVLMLRDYHAQNLLLLPDRAGVRQVGLLDFQDAMLAHPAYDLVSILQDARRDVAPETEQDILQYYLAKTPDAEPDFDLIYATLGLQRNLRILGIFARLCLRDGKPEYVDLIPRVWGYVQRNLTHPHLAPLATLVGAILPEPTTSFLESMKSRCPTPPSPS